MVRNMFGYVDWKVIRIAKRFKIFQDFLSLYDI